MNITCTSFRAFERNTLLGFADFTIVVLGLTIRDASVHRKGDSRWVSMPAKPQLDKERQLVHGDNGKPVYSQILQFETREQRDEFNEAALKALDDFKQDFAS